MWTGGWRCFIISWICYRKRLVGWSSTKSIWKTVESVFILLLSTFFIILIVQKHRQLVDDLFFMMISTVEWYSYRWTNELNGKDRTTGFETFSSYCCFCFFVGFFVCWFFKIIFYSFFLSIVSSCVQPWGRITRRTECCKSEVSVLVF